MAKSLSVLAGIVKDYAMMIAADANYVERALLKLADAVTEVNRRLGKHGSLQAQIDQLQEQHLALSIRVTDNATSIGAAARARRQEDAL